MIWQQEPCLKMKNKNFTKDLIPVGKVQEKKTFTLKPRLKKALAWRKRGPKLSLLQSVKVVEELEKMNTQENANG